MGGAWAPEGAPRLRPYPDHPPAGDRLGLLRLPHRLRLWKRPRDSPRTLVGALGRLATGILVARSERARGRQAGRACPKETGLHRSRSRALEVAPTVEALRQRGPSGLFVSPSENLLPDPQDSHPFFAILTPLRWGSPEVKKESLRRPGQPVPSGSVPPCGNAPSERRNGLAPREPAGLFLLWAGGKAAAVAEQASSPRRPAGFGARRGSPRQSMPCVFASRGVECRQRPRRREGHTWSRRES